MTPFETSPKLLEQFKTESKDNISKSEAAILGLEKAGNTPELIDNLFRCIHTIKGSADYLNLNELKNISHAFENVLDDLRKSDHRAISAERTDLFFQVLDLIESLVNQAPNETSGYSQKCTELNALLKVKDQDSASAHSDLTKKEAKIESTGEDKSIAIFRSTVIQQLEILLYTQEKIIVDQAIDPTLRGRLSRALKCIENGCLFLGEKELENSTLQLRNWILSPSQSKAWMDCHTRVQAYISDLQFALNHLADKNKDNPQPLAEPTPLQEPHLQAEHSFNSNSLGSPEIKLQFETKTVRVEQVVLDRFMNLVGELIVARNTFPHLQAKFLGSAPNQALALKELRESSNLLTQITGELQRNLMAMRMVPIKTVFEKYSRVVRDICRKTGKQVEVVFHGEDTEADKGIADQISEPLMHLVRNAVDHGIETVSERIQAKKSPSGTLIMKAFYQGNFMVIEITDDGAGIDIESVRTKLIEKGIMAAERAAQLSNPELLDQIFAPGFSTADQITELSGRGVGLDVVRTNLKQIKGRVSVSTELNQGTCFRLELPLTIAIMRALLFKQGQSIYAIALEDVLESVKIDSSELKTLHRELAISLRGEVIPVKKLSQILEQKDTELVLDQSKSSFLSNQNRISVLILKTSGGKFGIIVDAVLKQEEIVVKPLPETYLGVKGIAGASILGDGKAILILDSNQLYGSFLGRTLEVETLLKKEANHEDSNHRSR